MIEDGRILALGAVLGVAAVAGALHGSSSPGPSPRPEARGQRPNKGQRPKGSLSEMPELLRPRGRVGFIGHESGRSIQDGIAMWVASYGPRHPTSIRYVVIEGGEILSALQVVVLPGAPREARITTVMTRPDRRRQGLARRLIERARRDFVVVHSPEIHLSEAGLAWARAVGGPVAGQRVVAGQKGSQVRVGPRLRASALVPVDVSRPVFLPLSNHLAELGAIHREESDFVWDPERPVVATSKADAMKRARRDYDHVLGKTFRVTEVTGKLGGTFDETETWPCHEGCLVKVLPASDQDIEYQWSSTDRLDPIWPVELVGATLPEADRVLADLEWAYVRGRSYVVVSP